MQGEHAIMSQEKSLIIHGQDFHLQQIDDVAQTIVVFSS